MIQLQHLQIGYDQPLFSIESVQLEKGNVYCLIGANGAGKTTFLQTLQGNISPMNGEIKINSKNIQTFTRQEKATCIAFVNSKFDGIEYLKVRDYVALGRTPYTNALGRLSERDKSKVDESIAQLKINHLSELYTTQLSDGERQLAACARAICQETDLIILDEPTAFLDYANRKLLIEEMKRIALTLNKCVLLSSHDIELCLESQNELLVITKKEKQLVLIAPNSISKEELVGMGF